MAAINEMGKGPYSSEVLEDLQQHMPTPLLLVVSDKSLIKLDADLQEEMEVLSEDSRVQWVTPLLKNSSFAWMDMNSDIYLTDMKTNFTQRVGIILQFDFLLFPCDVQSQYLHSTKCKL